MSTEVFIIDDNDSFRQSLKWLLETDGLSVQAFPDADAFLAYQQKSLDPEGTTCLLLDIRMPGMSGLELQDTLIKKGVMLPIVFMTAHADVSVAVEAMRKGAFNFLEKPFSDELLLKTIRAALEHATQQKTRSSTDVQAQARVNSLTPRERQVLDMVVEGKLNKTIADKLGISIKTVELHRSHMMEKMQAKTLAHLIQMAVSVRR